MIVMTEMTGSPLSSWHLFYSRAWASIAALSVRDSTRGVSSELYTAYGMTTRADGR
jgi:hypothetical protein